MTQFEETLIALVKKMIKKLEDIERRLEEKK